MASTTLNNGRSTIRVYYNGYTDGNSFYVYISRVDYASGGGCDVRFTADSDPYYLSYDGEWYNTTFRISNLHNPDDGFYNKFNAETYIYFDRNTGSTDYTPVAVTFYLDGLPRSIWVSMPALYNYPVRYNQGVITGSVYNMPDDQVKFDGVTLTLSSDRPSAEYGTFQHWNTSSNDNGTSYSPGARYDEDSSLYLYAIWKLNTYRVTYNANGGSNAPSSQTKVAGETLRLSNETPTKSNYTFDYWTTNQNGSGSVYYPGGSYTSNSDVTLYAQWTAERYTVTYNANGGQNAPSSQTKVAGETLYLSSSTPSRYGYVFKKWNTDSDGSGTSYNPGASYTRNESLYLYAVWEAEKYTLSFDANGGTGGPSSKTVSYGESIDIPDSTPRRTGYTFVYWSNSNLGSPPGSKFYPGETVSGFIGNTTYYAIWELIYYTITYLPDSDDYVYSPEIQSKPYNEDVTITSWTPARYGYNFDRWNTNSSGTGTNYRSGDTYNKNADVTLYAITYPKQNIVAYDSNGGSGAPDPQTKTFEQDLRLSETRPTRAGYTFAGWSINRVIDEWSDIWQPGEYLTHDFLMDIILYAVWMPGIFYDANGGSGAPSVQIIFDEDPITLSTSIPVRDNHTFLYWNTNRNGTGTRYDPGATYTPANTRDNVFLYAIWRRDPDRPTVSAMLVTRCNSVGTLDDEGTYMRISVTWNVDTVRRSGNTGQCKLYYKLSSNPSWILVHTSSWSTSYTSTKIISNISTDEQYDVKAVITDADSRITERIDILTRAKFVWDIAVGGEAMGIGSAAPPAGLEVGWLAQFDENVTMLKNLIVTGSITTQNNISAPNFNITNTADGIIQSSSYWTVSGQVVYLFGPLCSINITLAPSRIYEIGEVNEIVAVIGEAYRPIVGQAFGTYWGLGYINTSGEIHFQNYQVISDSSQLQIGLTYIRQQTS